MGVWVGKTDYDDGAAETVGEVYAFREGTVYYAEEEGAALGG